MRGFSAAVCALLVIYGVSAVPRPDKRDEVEIVPLEKNPYGDQPIIDTGVGGWESPFSNPFDGLFQSFDSLITRMRQQMETLLKRLPGAGTNSSAEIPDFPLEGLPHLPFGDIDLSKGNTTSVTKVIDGHKVVINETEYKKQDDFGGAFFKVRIIDVKPDSSESTTEKEAEEVTVAPETKSPEPIANSVENEIPKSPEVVSRFGNVESFNEFDALEPQQAVNVQTRDDTEWQELAPIEVLDDNTVSLERTQKPFDLSRDIYVNQLLADQGAPINPDAEVFSVPEILKNRPSFEKFIDPR